MASDVVFALKYRSTTGEQRKTLNSREYKHGSCVRKMFQLKWYLNLNLKDDKEWRVMVKTTGE